MCRVVPGGSHLALPSGGGAAPEHTGPRPPVSCLGAGVCHGHTVHSSCIVTHQRCHRVRLLLHHQPRPWEARIGACARLRARDRARRQEAGKEASRIVNLGVDCSRALFYHRWISLGSASSRQRQLGVCHLLRLERKWKLRWRKWKSGYIISIYQSRQIVSESPRWAAEVISAAAAAIFVSSCDCCKLLLSENLKGLFFFNEFYKKM